jgi:CHAT domain-containing protein
VRLAGGIIYGALILTHETVDGPAVSLIKSTASQRLEKQFYKNYSNSIRFDFADSTSYNTFWKPIHEVLNKNSAKGKKIDRVYFSSDGVYNKINLNTLYDPSTHKYLIDQLEIVQVTNMKEVLQDKSKTKGVEKTAVLFGRPQFYLPGKERKTILSDLPGTEKEVDQIDSLLRKKGWKTRLYKFEKANEGVVKTLQSPTVLHFATHGFVVQDSLRNDLADVMLNAGIVLAGAGTENSSDEDGILSAYEMMSVDLDNTQLVVLSACETGLGEYYNGEGVYGLQRAIRSAGSKATIMSLWKVDDAATQKLMTIFYTTWLQQKKDAREAFRTAQLELIKTYPQPRYWGAFVFGGK